MSDGRKYYCFCDMNCKFETMTKEQIYELIAQAAENGLVFDTEAAFITKVKESNAGGFLTFWVGTEAQYNAMPNKDPNCLYHITDSTKEDALTQLLERLEKTAVNAEAVATEASININAHLIDYGNPHGVTTEQIGAATLDYAKKVGAPFNLLDNSSFTINQRGEEYYGEGVMYTLDRWKKANKLEVSDMVIEGGVHLYCADDATDHYGMTQYLEKSLAEGEVVTLAAMTHDGVLYCGSVAIPSGTGRINAFVTEDRVIGRLYADRVTILVPPAGEIWLDWVALYKGEYTAETLPAYQYKGYAAELAECQRYYIKYDAATSDGEAVSAFGYTGSATVAYVTITTPVEMRETPDVLGDILFNLKTNSTKAAECPIGASIWKVGNQLRFTINITDKGLTANQVIAAVRGSGTLAFTADLNR